MPTLVPSVTKDPSIRFPSTWKDGKGKPLTNSIITQYIRLGRYGKDLQQRQLARDHATVVEGKVMLAKDCQECHKRLGHFMRFAYLPHAGYYCDHCRNTFKNAHKKSIVEKRKWSLTESYE